MKGRRGSAIIETSLSLLLLLLVTLAIVDCGRYLYAANLLPYLAQEGARYASLQGDGVDEVAVRRHVRGFVAGLPPDSVQVDVTLHRLPSAVTVRTSYTFSPAAGVVLGSSVAVRGQARLVLATARPTQP